MNRKQPIVLMLALMLLASALTYFLLGLNYGFRFGPYRSSSYTAGSGFNELLEIIDSEYIGSFDAGEAANAAMRAAVNSLGDRWSYYITPDEYSEFVNNMNNQFAGIGVGVLIDEETGGMAIMSIYRGSPAEKAGIIVGDLITHIDGENLRGMDLTEMKTLLARPIGETVVLTVQRASGIVEDVDVVFDMVFVDPISYEMLTNNTGYIRIANFDKGAAGSFLSAIDNLLDEGALAFIFDVRNNGGGRVNEMTKMLDYLLPEGEIFIAVDKSGKEEITLSGESMIDIPAVVLVNRYSFSAAEYFAAILQEYGYAEVIGEQTSGKSRSQQTIELSGGGALHISTGEYLTKNRVALYDVGGLTPDHILGLTDNELYLFVSGNLDKENDPQLQLAMSVLLK